MGQNQCMSSVSTSGLASLRVIPTAEFAGLGRRIVGIEESVAKRCLHFEAVDVDMWYARICSRTGAQVNQHQNRFSAGFPARSSDLGFPTNSKPETFSGGQEPEDGRCRQGRKPFAPSRAWITGTRPSWRTVGG